MNPTPSPNRHGLRWLPIGLCVFLLIAVGLQWRSLKRLRQENDSLRAEAQARATETPPQPDHSNAAGNDAQAQDDRLELLRLRNEVRELRQKPTALAESRPCVLPPTPPPVPAANAQPANDGVQQLIAAAMRGDSTALDKLAELTKAARAAKPEEQEATRSAMKAAFVQLGVQAGKGDATALQTLWQASRLRELQGFAVNGLGQAAAFGNEDALKTLIDPEAYLLLRSSTTSALKPAADAGNERAIQALAATATDPKQRALWLLAAQGLETAAAAGNSTAIDGLASVAASDNQTISKQAVLALEAAARNNQPRAVEALKRLGWR